MSRTVRVRRSRANPVCGLVPDGPPWMGSHGRAHLTTVGRVDRLLADPVFRLGAVRTAQFRPAVPVCRQPFGLRKVLFLAGGFVLSLGLFALYRRLWSRGSPLAVRIAVGLGASAAAGAAWFVLCELLIVRQGWSAFLGSLPGRGPVYLSLYANLSSVFVSWTAIHFGWLFWRDLQHSREQGLRAEAAARRAELEMLRYQLNPHFLFNALNSLRALIEEEPARARHMVDELAEFLRTTLLPIGGDSVPLEREIEFARTYLCIEQVRFEDKLVFDIRMDPGLGGLRVPSFLLHPLVEKRRQTRTLDQCTAAAHPAGRAAAWRPVGGRRLQQRSAGSDAGSRSRRYRHRACAMSDAGLPNCTRSATNCG